MNQEKGLALTTPSSVPKTRSHRFGSPKARIHPTTPSPALPKDLNGIHDASLYQRHTDHFEQGAPFRLEHHLHHEHPLRHPNAVHWRSAYSVISLHRKYKELQESGGYPHASDQRNHHRGMRTNRSLTGMGNLSNEVDAERITRLEEENVLLRAEVEEKTETIEQLKETLKANETASADLQQRLRDSGVNVERMQTQFEEMQQYRQKLIAKTMRRWKNADISRTFQVWHDTVTETKKNRRLIARFSARWSRSGLHGSFVRWHDLCKSEKYNRAVIKRFAAKFNNQALSKCFNKWHHTMEETSRLKRLQHKVAKRFLLRHLSSAFHGWYVVGVGLFLWFCGSVFLCFCGLCLCVFCWWWLYPSNINTNLLLSIFPSSFCLQLSIGAGTTMCMQSCTTEPYCINFPCA
jgi:hypothetical protein